MDTGFVTSVTITEFLVWYSTGELRIHRRRLLPISIEPSGIPDKDETMNRQIMEMLPHVDLEDEHSVLVVTLSKDPIKDIDQTGVGNYPLPFDMAYVTVESILSIHPLTQRGGEIMKSRLYDLGLHLGSPMFEKETNQLWHEWSFRRSIKGAEALIALVIKEPTFKPSPEFMKQAEEAIRLINEQRETSPQGGLLIYVMCYNRHGNIPNNDIGYFIDLGIILSQYKKALPGIQPIVDSVRQFCKTFQKDNDNRKLNELLMVSDVQKTFRDFLDGHNSEIDLSAAVIFLKWKYLMQLNQRLEIRNVLNDVRNYSGRVTKITLEKALWLLGFYCGFDRMANEYYMRAEYGRYRFIEKRITNEPVELSVDVVELPSEGKKSKNISSTHELKKEAISEVAADDKILKGEGSKREESTSNMKQGQWGIEGKSNDNID